MLGRLLGKTHPHLTPAGPPMGDVTRFFHPVLKASELGKEPRRVLLANEAYVLFRGPGGKPAALRDRCPHRFAPLSAGKVRADGRLVCPYHGWHFDTNGHGQSPSQPELARCDAQALQVVERRGFLWVANTDVPIDRFPELSAEGYQDAGAFSARFEAPLHVALDNFSEDEHTPWVHTRLGWDEGAAAAIRFEARNFDDRTEVHYEAAQRNRWLGRLLLLQPGDTFHNRWVTRFDPVRTEYSLYWTRGPEAKPTPVMTRAVIFFVPETEQITWLHVFLQVKLNQPKLRPLSPVIKRAAWLLGWAEVDDDRRFIPTVAGTPTSLKGMRLGKYDKPVIHNRKLLERIYLGRPEEPRLELVTPERV